MPVKSEQTLFGHPKGLYYLTFTEVWERFSFYGMTALVVLYMVNRLLLPGHAGDIAGFAQFRAIIESVTGPLSTQALAAQIFGLYSGFVYFTPLLGGMIADRWIGQRNAVVIGAILMSAGHIAMTFDASFLLALLLLVLGSGLLKGNLSSQVGALYPDDDEARRTRGFMVLSAGIGLGAVAGPILCGWLAQVYGWHYGFGVAAAFMLVGLGIYLSGYRDLPARVERKKVIETARLSANDWRTLLALCLIIGITIFISIGNNQIYNVGPVWTQQYVIGHIGALAIPVPWYQALYAFVTIAGVPLVFWIWRRQASRKREPHDIAKIGIGAVLAAASNLMLVAGIAVSAGGQVHPVWPIAYCIVLGFSFLYYWPTLLSLVSRASPARVNATMMGVVFMSLFVSNILIGWIGSFYERMSTIGFWAMHAGISALGGILVLLLGRRLGRVL